jgi:hypothetical protein
MKTKVITILAAAVILLGASETWATNISFFEDGVIQDGDVYEVVGIFDHATVDMFGGNVGLIEAWNYSTVNLYGGIISDYLLATSTVNIYGYGFDYDPIAGNDRGGQLTGFWVDDTPFSIDLYYLKAPGAPFIDTWSHITLIPEPTTILLLGLGAINIRISKFRIGEKS